MQKQKNSQKYFYSKFSFLKYIIKSRFFYYLINKCPNIFFLPKDLISAESILTGKHEQHLTKLIKDITQKHNDFFIDIGGHIGLYTCLLSQNFKKIFTFEPNPIIYNILKTNVSLNEHNEKISTYNYGLSLDDNDATMLIPKKNTGGAFLLSQDNTKKQLIKFDDSNFENNFLKKNVKIRSVKKELLKVSELLERNNLKKGFIKIDAEGSDLLILQEILKLSLNINFVILMELFGIDDSDIRKLSQQYPNCKFYFHISDNFFYKGKNKFKKIYNIFFKKIYSELQDINNFYDKGYKLSNNPFYSVDLVIFKN